MSGVEVKYSIVSEIFTERLWAILDELNRKTAAFSWGNSDSEVLKGLTIRLMHQTENNAGRDIETFQMLKTKLAVLTCFVDLNTVEKADSKIDFIREMTLGAIRKLEANSDSSVLTGLYPQFHQFFQQYALLDGGDPSLSPKEWRMSYFDYEGRSRDIVRLAMKDKQIKTLPKLDFQQGFENMEFFLQILLAKLNKKDSQALIARLLLEGKMAIEEDLKMDLLPSRIQAKFMSAIIAFVRDTIFSFTVENRTIEFLQVQRSHPAQSFLMFLDGWSETHIHISALPPSSWLKKLVGKRNFAKCFQSI